MTRLILLMLALVSSGAIAQSYPVKPVRLIVADAAGGAPDQLGRILAQKLSESLGQQVIVDNRPGAAGVLGADIASKAPADGYTLLLTTTSIYALLPSLKKNLPYDPVKDFAPVSRIATASNVLVVNVSLPVKSIADLVELAKSKPGVLNYASAGIGSPAHLAGEVLNLLAGIKVAHVPYKGGGPSMTALVSGETDFNFATGPVATPQIKAGRVRGVGVTTAKRSSAFPDLPALTTIFPGLESDNWYAMFFPAGTPKPIIDKLNSEIAKALKTKEIVDFMPREALDAVASSPEELAANFKREIDRYARIIKAGNITLE